jgi:hypothetical protein
VSPSEHTLETGPPPPLGEGLAQWKIGLVVMRDPGYSAYYPKRDTRRGREAAVMDPRKRLQQVLAGQQFPAERWELIVGADLYGADALTKSELHSLPAVRFRSLADVLHAVERCRADAVLREQGSRSA